MSMFLSFEIVTHTASIWPCQNPLSPNIRIGKKLGPLVQGWYSLSEGAVVGLDSV